MDRPIMLRPQIITSARAGKRTHVTMPSSFIAKGRVAVGEEARAKQERDGGMRMPTPWTKIRPGDRLFVQEDFAQLIDMRNPAGNRGYYKADLPGGHVPIPGSVKGDRYRTESYPAFKMTRESSRYWLSVVSTRIFPLQQISWDEVALEGSHDPHQSKNHWWDRSYGFTMPWASNETVVGIRFVFNDANIDTGEKWRPYTAEETAPVPRLGRGMGAFPVND